MNSENGFHPNGECTKSMMVTLGNVSNAWKLTNSAHNCYMAMKKKSSE